MSEPSVTVELFDAAEMDVQIRKMAHQVLGDFPDEERIKLVGIRRRGVSVADRLAAHLSRITGRAFDQGEITLKRYSDTLEVLHPVPVLTEAKIPFDVTGQWWTTSSTPASRSGRQSRSSSTTVRPRP